MPDQKPPSLDPDDLALIRHLFAKATALLEDAHEIAVEGQGPDLGQVEATSIAEELVSKASKVGAIANALVALSKRVE